MTTLPDFPVLPGQSWSVHKRPTFSTRIAAHVSGREVRSPFFAQALYEFELTYDGLSSTADHPGLASNSLQSLMGLYLQCQGQYGTFLYTDPSDCEANAQTIGLGTGEATSFTFQRSIGTFAEAVSWVTSVSAVYINGAAQTSGWSLTQPNTLIFADAPSSGTIITADFSYAFECRFIDDQADFENFMAGLWLVDSLKFRSVKA